LTYISNYKSPVDIKKLTNIHRKINKKQNKMNYQYNILESVSFKRNRGKQTNTNTVLSSASQKTLPIALTGKNHPHKSVTKTTRSNIAKYVLKRYDLKIPDFLNSKLYQKYSSSQIYYYKKDINSMINKQRVPPVIKWKDEKDYL
jgi:hypothetical protein